MHWSLIKIISLLWLAVILQGCDQAISNPAPPPAVQEVKTMQPTTFTCVLEKDHNPPLDPEGEHYFQQARTLEKVTGWEDWPTIVDLYQKAIEKNHWKAMNNLAIHYQKGRYGPDDKMDHPTGIKRDPAQAIRLYLRMVDLEVPMGYYNFAIAIGRGGVPNTQPKDAGIFMLKAANTGYPLAQVALGNHYSFGLPRAQQRDDIAEQYFKCAGRQDNTEALLEVAMFYEISKENKPLALYFYQKAASLGRTVGAMSLSSAFKEGDIDKLGYEANEELYLFYNQMRQQLQKDPELRFPNLMKEHPLPRHPTQGYDADNPDERPNY